MSLDDPKGGIALTLNGEAVTLGADPSARLSEVLRERAGARDVKVGCNAGDCGACTVLLDGEAQMVGRLEVDAPLKQLTINYLWSRAPRRRAAAASRAAR